MTPILGVIASQITGHLVTGSYDSIATVTASGGETSLTFSSIPQTYKHLQIRYIARSTSGGVSNITSTFNSSSTGYAYHGLYGDGTSALAQAASSTVNLLTGVINSTANIFSVGVIDILDYANTNKYKTLRDLNGADWNGSGYAVLYSGLWQNTAAINSISFGNATFAQYTSFALYGVKG